jgi:hypothetical protein
VDAAASTSPPPQAALQQGGQTVDAGTRLLFHPALNKPYFGDEAFQPALAAVLGAGLRSVIGENVPETRWRWFLGVRLQALGYNAGMPAEGFADTRGYFEAGFARDEFWRGLHMWRAYSEGQLEIPGVGGKWVRFLVRLKLDRPLGGGASEVRISALTSIAPSALGAFLGAAVGSSESK